MMVWDQFNLAVSASGLPDTNAVIKPKKEQPNNVKS
jgi:hypothetical protein